MKSKHTSLKKLYKLSKTNIFFSRFEGTRGEKTKYFAPFSFDAATFCPFETRLSLFNSCLFERLIFCQSVSSFVTICSNLFETWANCRISSTLEKDKIRQIISSGISPKWHCFFDLMTYDWKCHMYSGFKIKKKS